MNRLIAAVSVSLLLGSAGSDVVAQAQMPPVGYRDEQLLYVALNVNDWDKSKDFYGRVLGLKVVPRPAAAPSPAGSTIENETFSFSGTYQEPFLVIQRDRSRTAPYQPGDGLARITFKVTDVRATLTRVRAAGYRVARDLAPSESGTSLQAHVVDPNGYIVQIQGPA